MICLFVWLSKPVPWRFLSDTPCLPQIHFERNLKFSNSTSLTSQRLNILFIDYTRTNLQRYCFRTGQFRSCPKARRSSSRSPATASPMYHWAAGIVLPCTLRLAGSYYSPPGRPQCSWEFGVMFATDSKQPAVRLRSHLPLQRGCSSYSRSSSASDSPRWRRANYAYAVLNRKVRLLMYPLSHIS